MVEHRRAAAGLLAVAVLALTGCGGSADGSGVVSGVTVSDPDGMNGAVLTEPYRWPAATLVDSHGDDLDIRAGLRTPLTLVFFGYSRCPDICQAVMADLASAVARLDEAQASKVAVWFVTTDPARDDPAALRAYLDRFNPDFEGLTGSLDDIKAVADAVHVTVEQGPRLPSGGYEITHGTPVLGVTPNGEVPIVWTQGTSAAKIAADIHTILTDGIPTDGESGS